MAEVYLFKVNYAIRFIKNTKKAGLVGPFPKVGNWEYLECYVFANEATEAERLTKESLETIHQKCQIKISVYRQLATFDTDSLPGAGRTVHCISAKGIVAFEMPDFF
jgi:hypothetical protein